MPAARGPHPVVGRGRVGWLPHRLPRAAGVVGALVLLLVLAAAPAPLASGPRPLLDAPGVGLADRWVPPRPHVGERFTTLPFVDASARVGTWVVPDARLPVPLTVEREVAERYGIDRLARALEVWNGTPGSRFGLSVTGLTDEGVDHAARDGVNRVFLDRRDCGDRFLARAHLHPGEIQVLPRRSVAWIGEVDIGICERLPVDLLARVTRHEVAHVAGLGHLCEADADCWVPAMGTGNRCRLMNPSAYACQEPTAGDVDGLIHLYPKLPRVAGDASVGTAAAVSFLAFPAVRSEHVVVATSAEADVELQAAAAVLAGLHGWPHLLVDADCTHGADGEELNRVASVGATVALVGPVPTRCEDDLRAGWEFDTARLPDIRDVTDQIVATVGEPTRLVVAARPDGDGGGVADALVGVPAAVGLRGPLLTTAADRLDRHVAQVLDAVPSITGVVLLGDTDHVGTEVERVLVEEHGVRVRRLTAADRVDLGLTVARMRDVFGGVADRAVLVAGDRAADGVAAANLAALTGAAVVPVFTGPAAPDVRVATHLADHVEAGYVVGGEEALGHDLHLRLNRALDDAL